MRRARIGKNYHNEKTLEFKETKLGPYPARSRKRRSRRNSAGFVRRAIQNYAAGYRRAELHWYEAHGIGRKEIKRKRYVD
jgi:hypothetical protein